MVNRSLGLSHHSLVIIVAISFYCLSSGKLNTAHVSLGPREELI